MSKTNSKHKNIFLDSALGKDGSVPDRINGGGANGAVSILFSRGKRSESFFTEDSQLYITPKEYALLKKGEGVRRRVGKWDSLGSRFVEKYRLHRPGKSDFLYKKYLHVAGKYEEIRENLKEQPAIFINRMSVLKLWNASILAAIIIGMVSMSFIYKNLGQSASAVIQDSQPAVMGIMDEKETEEDEWTEEKERVFVDSMVEYLESKEKEALEEKIREMVKGYPMEKMLPHIMEKDRMVISFLIGIAKKESNWGKRVPVLNGQDCYNYWGYRGQRKLMGSGGHTCFNSRKDAVDTVAKRLETLIQEYDRNTPEEMVVWKCGSSCAATGGQAAADKWISDVDMYFSELNSDE